MVSMMWTMRRRRSGLTVCCCLEAWRRDSSSLRQSIREVLVRERENLALSARPPLLFREDEEGMTLQFYEDMVTDDCFT
jgi:hypothetical protein